MNTEVTASRLLSRADLPEISTLLHELNISQAFSGEVKILGSDPLLHSPHRLADASAFMLALNGVSAATLWKDKTGQSTTITIDTKTALNHLHDSDFIWQNGYKMVVGADKVPINSFFQCADGRFIHTIAGPPYLKLLNGYLNFFNCGHNPDAIARAVLRWNAFDLEEALAERGLPGCVVRTEAEWACHSVGRALKKRPCIEIEKISDGKPIPFDRESSALLSGIKVLDFTHVLAGPLCAQNLSLFGADVLHITSPYHRDTIAQNLAANLGKTNAYLDLNTITDRNRMYELLKEADVFSFSYRPSIADRFNLSVHNIADTHPRGIVYVSINCYGFNNDWSERPGFETIGQACTGISIEEGSNNIPSYNPVFYLCDPLTSHMAFNGVLAALRRRAIEGGSYHVKVSLVKTGMWVKSLGNIAPRDYHHLPKADHYTAELEEIDTHFGHITRLAEPYQFDQPIIPTYQQKKLEPFGFSPAQFSSANTR